MGKRFEDSAWRADNRVRLDFNNMMSAFLGERGLTEGDINALPLAKAVKAMADKRKSGGMDWRDLPRNQAEVVKDVLSYVNEMKGQTDAFVVFGIGGSALGPIAVQQAINHPYYNELPREKRGGFPKLYVADNVDPERLVYLFDTIDITKSLFNVISKSGSTSETMSQFMIIKSLLEEKLGKAEAAKRIVCTTDSQNGNLIKIAKQEGYKTFIIPSGVGGRFSELTPVGLLPAAFCGVNIEELLAGAGYMDDLCSEPDVMKNPAYLYAALNVLGMARGKNVSVMMPYADSLKYIAHWYGQLWAESLGKKFDADGNVVNVGPTPQPALGVTDQHSQLQLYAEGPFDKMVVFISVGEFREEIVIPKIYEDIPSLGFLGGVPHSRLIDVERVSTEYALTKAGKLNMTVSLPRVNEFTLGQLLYLLEVATGFAGELLNINAFDQPGVEEGKNCAYAFFGRPGYEEKKKELDAIPKKEDRYVI